MEGETIKVRKELLLEATVASSRIARQMGQMCSTSMKHNLSQAEILVQ